MEKTDKIFVAGSEGFLGLALLRILKSQGYENIIAKTAKELNLFDGIAVSEFFKAEKPDYVFLAASKSGSIKANIAEPADFIYKNLIIQNNIIHNAYLNDVKKLLFFGASCVYPKNSSQPIKEESLLTGDVEETSRAYAVAKIAGIEMSRAYNKQYGTKFISIIPATMYGPGDKFDPENSHVLTGLIRRFNEAKSDKNKEIVIWGTGDPRREFIYVDDVAHACIFIANKEVDFDLLNVGFGEDLTIKELAERIKAITGFEGDIKYDASMPDGAMKKLLDSSKIKSLGWTPKIGFDEGLKITQDWFLKNYIKQYS